MESQRDRGAAPGDKHGQLGLRSRLSLEYQVPHVPRGLGWRKSTVASLPEAVRVLHLPLPVPSWPSPAPLGAFLFSCV